MVSSSASSFDLAGGADTIVAPATPPGSGALAVVRVSGPGVASVARSVCPGLDLARPRYAQLVGLRRSDGEVVERGIVIPYVGPSSYTGEDMLEVMVHGSPALVRGIVALFVGWGCRIAERGEFTRRAVANGKIDLLQAEGIADLIRAQTELEVTAARGLVAGRLSSKIRDLRRDLVELMAWMEGALDFAGQGVGENPGELEARRARVVEQLEELLSTVRTGQRVREGLRVVIVGPPNAGKSTLFNRLLQTERSIVTPEPGTTRDFIEAEVDIGGLRVILVDTAGLGAGAEIAEREGIRRSLEMARNADILIDVSSAIENNGAAM
ncbi:MAG: GTP-binding protein, partial [Acidobacteria bacterium]|nr:GTP-binding protein [Acidobacteriota bacterium]